MTSTSSADGEPERSRRRFLRRDRRVPALAEFKGLVAWLGLVVVLGAVYGWVSSDEARTYAQRGAFTTASVVVVDDCDHPRWGSIQVEVLGERAHLGCSEPIPRVGDAVRVQYDTADPRVARRVGAGGDRVALVLVVGGGGAGALALGSWVLLRFLQVRLRPEVEERFRAERSEREPGRGPSWRWPSHRGRHRR